MQFLLAFLNYLVMLSIFSCACWSSVCLLWRHFYLGLLLNFRLGCLKLHEFYEFVSESVYDKEGHLMNEKYLDKKRQQKHNHGCVAEVQT